MMTRTAHSEERHLQDRCSIIRHSAIIAVNQSNFQFNFIFRALLKCSIFALHVFKEKNILAQTVEKKLYPKEKTSI